MSGVYSVEDLLKLRASPLIRRPPNLPPIEEWMGSAEANPKRTALRAKAEESTFQSEGFQKRPNLSESQRRSTTDPERIVLGPPRRSFASSTARSGLKLAGDGPDDGTSYKEKGEHTERTRNGEGTDKASSRTNGASGRLASRADHDSSQPVRSRRRVDDSEDSSRTRPDGDRIRDRDRPRWGPREGRDEMKALEEDNNSDHPPRSNYRRDGGARTRYEQPWSRNERNIDQEDTTRSDDRGLEWRSERAKPRDWDRSAKIESDPEWMDALEDEEAAPARTQEDFERWKERMRAGAMTSAAVDEKVESIRPDDHPATAQETSKPIPKPAVVESDEAMNKFFARFNDTKPATEQKAGLGKSTTKTRFASLFTHPAEIAQPAPPEALPELAFQPPVQEKATTPAAPSIADADQAGFARILEMLQTRGSNSSAHSQDNKTRTPLYTRDGHPKPDPEVKPPPQSLMSLFGQPQSSSNAPPPERLPEAKSPVETTHNRQQSSISKDEVLLNLLRQASLAPKPQFTSPQPHEQRGAAPIYTGQDMGARTNPLRHPAISPVPGPDPITLQRRDAGRLMFNESPPTGISYMDDPGMRDGFPRGLPNLPNQAFYEDQYLNSLRQGGHNQQQNNPQGGQHNFPGLPPGLQRPPGLDQMPRPPPGWPNAGPPPPPQQTSMPQISRHPAPPPGIPNLPRGMSGNFAAPPGMPQPSAQNQGTNIPRPPQRKYTGDLPMPNFPPGIGPPPGFINHGPPPGFPGAPPPPQNHSRFQFGPGDPALPPQNMGRAFMEMYSNEPPRNTVRGGAAPTNYR